MSARGRYAFLREKKERILRERMDNNGLTAATPTSFVPKKGRTKNKTTTTTTTRVALFPEEINKDKRSNRAKRDEHSHLQFSSRWRVHQHGVLVSLRGHFQTLRQGSTQRDRRGGGGGGGGGFDTTNARSSRNSGVSLCEGGSGLDRCAQRQRRHPLFTVVWNELGLSARLGL